MKAFSKKLHFGRIVLPLWALALAGIAVVGAAGQAVGPMLSGSVAGSAGFTVEQVIALDTTSSIAIGGHGDDDLGVMNDEGTSFTAAIELQVGDIVTMTIPVVNVSDADANAVLEILPPPGVDVEVGDTSFNLDELKMAAHTWLLFVDKDNSDDLVITISPKDDLKPGVYTISGRIVQITG